MSHIEIKNKVDELRQLKRMADELAAEIESVQDSIKAHMTAADLDELHGVDFKITWKEVKSSRLDTAALKKAAPDMVAAFTKTTTSRRFCLA